MLDDAAAHDYGTEAAFKPDDAIYCAGCGHLVTRRRWRISRRDAHEHTVFNPAGRLFTIVCFKEAPGAVPQGAASGDFTWFPGYRWTISVCLGCAVHIGWRFEGSDVFFGLIKSRLADRRP